MQIKRKTKVSRPRKATAPQASSDLFTVLCKRVLGVECVKEYRFHDKRKWRFDYAIPEHKIAIEVEGGVWTGGRHTSPKGFLGDMEKYNTATVMGWRVLRTTPEDLLARATFLMIRRTIVAGLSDEIDNAKNEE